MNSPIVAQHVAGGCDLDLELVSSLLREKMLILGDAVPRQS